MDESIMTDHIYSVDNFIFFKIRTVMGIETGWMNNKGGGLKIMIWGDDDNQFISKKPHLVDTFL